MARVRMAPLPLVTHVVTHELPPGVSCGDPLAYLGVSVLVWSPDVGISVTRLYRCSRPSLPGLSLSCPSEGCLPYTRHLRRAPLCQPGLQVAWGRTFHSPFSHPVPHCFPPPIMVHSGMCQQLLQELQMSCARLCLWQHGKEQRETHISGLASSRPLPL